MAASTHEYGLFMTYCEGQMSLETYYLRADTHLMKTGFVQFKCVSHSCSQGIPEHSSIPPFLGTKEIRKYVQHLIDK